MNYWWWFKQKDNLYTKKFICIFHLVDFHCISLGFHIDIKTPNIEIHLPFGFIKIGFHYAFPNSPIEFGFSSYRGIVKERRKEHNKYIEA